MRAHPARLADVTVGEEKGRSHAASSCPDTNLMEALNPRWIWQIGKEEKLRHRGIKRLPVELGVPGVRKKELGWRCDLEVR